MSTALSRTESENHGILNSENAGNKVFFQRYIVLCLILQSQKQMKRVLKCNQAATMAGVSTRSLKGLMETDNFPLPIMVGKAHGWIDTEIQAWIDLKIVERDAGIVGGAE